MQTEIRKLLLVLPLFAAACGDAADNGAVPGGRTIRVTVGSGPRSGSERNSTRTEIGDDGETIRWSTDDEIALWASASDGSAVFEALPFAMYHYDAAYGEASFTGDVPEMTAGDYIYYAAAPHPESFEGTEARYTIPAMQEFPGGESAAAYTHLPYDILAADPVAGEALTEGDNSDRVHFAFRHKTHLLKLRIGENGLGRAVTHIVLTFPRPVTGTVALDAADPGATLRLTGGGSRTLTLRFDRPAEAGTTVHAAILPEDFTGEGITIRAYSEGRESFERTIIPQRPFAEGHTTPIRYNVPAAESVFTTLRLHLAGDGTETLGEPVRSFTLTAPEGCKFDNGSNERTFDYAGPTYEMHIAAPADAALSGQRIGVAYESEHAVVHGGFTMPQLASEQVNDLPALTVPWLFEERFDGVATNHFHDNTATGGFNIDGNTEGIALDGWGLPGWTAARVGAEAGKMIRICARTEHGAIYASRYHGRADSPALAGIREGASVTVEVSFDYGAGYQNHDFGMTAACGHTTAAGAIGSTTGTGWGIENATAITPLSYNGSFDSAPDHAVYRIDGCTARHRLSWEVNTTGNQFGKNANHWLYIDNVRVKIVR